MSRKVSNGGTLFFDEVQALNLGLQAKLLRALQERVIRRVGGRENIEVDVRIIAATNQDIVEAMHRCCYPLDERKNGRV